MIAATKPPPRLPPAPPLRRQPPAQVGAKAAKQFIAAVPEAKNAFRVCIYGTGGIGKSSLAMSAPDPVKFIDLDDSLGVLVPMDGVQVVRGVETWQDLMDALRQDDLWSGAKSIVIDTATKAEELCVAHVLEKNHVASIELVDGGFGKGYKIVFETYLALFAELERHNRAGRNTIMIAHDKIEKKPNPAGQDFIRFSPRLQDVNNGSVSHKLKEWSDHLLFIGYDFAEAVKDKKSIGVNTRTIHPVEQPHFVAKSRSLRDPIPYEEGSVALWEALFKK